MKKWQVGVIAFLACIIGSIALAKFAPDPHEQVVEGIKAAADACREIGPRTDYERKVCALVAP